MLQEGRVFKDQEDMTVWIKGMTKPDSGYDLQTDILIGSIKMDLVGRKILPTNLR